MIRQYLPFCQAMISCLKNMSIYSDYVKAWLFLLGVFTPWSSTKQRQQILIRKIKEYENLKKIWANTPSQNSDKLQLLLKDLMKDAIRTDRTFPMFSGSHNVWLESMVDIITTWILNGEDRTYCQGMSDLLAPLLAVYKNEAIAFLAFDHLMFRISTHFDSGAGMVQQLDDLRELLKFLSVDIYNHVAEHDSLNMLFAYRWLLLHFKREFKVHEAMMLWDLIFSHYRTKCFPLFVGVAMMQLSFENLKQEREKVGYHGPEQKSPVHILQFFSRIANKLDVKSVIQTARQVVNCFSSRFVL
eukprot:m.149670 g.149670  ORF g.149670 m.149670 type:complete len:300 (-) comp13273_c1_seq3:300-1199(-)